MFRTWRDLRHAYAASDGDARSREPDRGGRGSSALRQAPPHPCRPAKEGVFAKGRHAIVLNVFTEPQWRRRGVAALLMNEIVRWAQNEKLDQLVLHSSPQARSLYERMGFNATNEMRFGRELKPENLAPQSIGNF